MDNKTTDLALLKEINSKDLFEIRKKLYFPNQLQNAIRDKFRSLASFSWASIVPMGIGSMCLISTLDIGKGPNPSEK